MGQKVQNLPFVCIFLDNQTPFASGAHLITLIKVPIESLTLAGAFLLKLSPISICHLKPIRSESQRLLLFSLFGVIQSVSRPL